MYPPWEGGGVAGFKRVPVPNALRLDGLGEFFSASTNTLTVASSNP